MVGVRGMQGPKGKKPSKEKLEDMHKQWQAGKSLKKLAEENKVSPLSVRRWFVDEDYLM